MKSGLPLTDQVDGVKMANHAEHDEVDAALTELQSSLEGSSISAQGDITHIPELSDYVRFLRLAGRPIKTSKSVSMSLCHMFMYVICYYVLLYVFISLVSFWCSVV